MTKREDDDKRVQAEARGDRMRPDGSYFDASGVTTVPAEREPECTPGPWETFPARPEPDDRVGVQSKLGPIVADCGLASNPHSIANARRIAKAPEMAELLGRLVANYDADWHIDTFVDQTNRITAEARALLASITEKNDDR